MIGRLYMKPIVLKTKVVKGICHAKGCQNRTVKCRICATCRSRKRRLADPVKYSYYNKKSRAKQRKSKRFPDGIPFTLTLEQFREFCYEVDYVPGQGRHRLSHDVDRIKEEEGYHIWNIQKLRKDKNIKKYLQYDFQTRHAKVWLGNRELVSSEEDFF
jgi:hypothetical protein